MKNIYVVNIKFHKLEQILEKKQNIIVYLTNSSSWNRLELATKLVLIENKLKTKPAKVPVFDEGSGLSPDAKVKWKERWTEIHPIGYRMDIPPKFITGTLEEYWRKKKTEVHLSDTSRYEGGKYLTECGDLNLLTTTSDSLPVYGIGIEGDGTLYGAIPLSKPNNSLIEELFGTSLSFREKFLLAHAIGGKEAIRDLGMELRIPDEIIEEVVYKIDNL